MKNITLEIGWNTEVDKCFGIRCCPTQLVSSEQLLMVGLSLTVPAALSKAFSSLVVQFSHSIIKTLSALWIFYDIDLFFFLNVTIVRERREKGGWRDESIN